jgi:hypothetical protein
MIVSLSIYVTRHKTITSWPRLANAGVPFSTYPEKVDESFSDVSSLTDTLLVDSSWNMMAHGDAQEGKWRGNWRMEWVASTRASSITTADAHTSAASSRLNWGPRRFKWTRPFRWKTKSGFCVCAITFQKQSTAEYSTLYTRCRITRFVITGFDCIVFILRKPAFDINCLASEWLRYLLVPNAWGKKTIGETET